MGWSLRRQCVDPVCGKRINPTKSGSAAVHGGCAYYFCSPQCWKAFQNAPTLYSAVPTPTSKGWWERYLNRVGKGIQGKPPCCQ
jgi:YHS domain-containing protein